MLVLAMPARVLRIWVRVGLRARVRIEVIGKGKKVWFLGTRKRQQERCGIGKK